MVQPLIRNPSLKNLPHEKWKDIPNFEGYYKISNYGRIKSLSRVVVTGIGVKETNDLILRPTLRKRYSKTTKKYSFSPHVSLSRDGIHYFFYLSRLVYTMFVEQLDYFDKSFTVTFKNKDSLNLYYKNLSKTTLIRQFNSKAIPITQYDANGQPIAWYESAYSAAKENGFTARTIKYAATGTTHIYKAFFWRHGKNKQRLNVDEIKLNVEHKTVNEELIKHVGLKNIDIKNPPAFLNLSLESLKGERWKDIPGYERLYQLSNFGRIKALKKISEGKMRKWKPEQIKRLTILLRTAGNGKQIPGRATVTVSKQSKKKQLAVQRYVYYLFVKEFDLNDPHFAVFFNDANPLNLHYKNLYLQWINRDQKVYKRKAKKKGVKS